MKVIRWIISCAYRPFWRVQKGRSEHWGRILRCCGRCTANCHHQHTWPNAWNRWTERLRCYHTAGNLWRGKYILGVAQYMYSYQPNRHGTDLSVRCMRPYDKYKQVTPNPEVGTRRNNRQQKNSECREMHAWKQSPLDSDHVLILNASLTWTDKIFVLVYPTSLIQHKSKYSIIFPCLRCNLSEC